MSGMIHMGNSPEARALPGLIKPRGIKFAIYYFGGEFWAKSMDSLLVHGSCCQFTPRFRTDLLLRRKNTEIIVRALDQTRGNFQRTRGNLLQTTPLATEKGGAWNDVATKEGKGKFLFPGFPHRILLLKKLMITNYILKFGQNSDT